MLWTYLLNLMVCRRRKEIELEAKEKSEEEKTEILKTEEVHDQQENEEKKEHARDQGD